MTRTPAAITLTELILETFRLNGQLLVEGDRLSEPLGLTSARWQVLGAIELASNPMSVALIGRRMGLSRQAVQRVANDLQADGFVTFEDNPDHARAKLIVPTKKGRDALAEIELVQTRWSNDLANGLDPKQLTSAVEILKTLRAVLQKKENGA